MAEVVKNVIVTGATGFIGRPVVDALKEKGYNVVRFVIDTPVDSNDIFVNILNPSDIKNAFEHLKKNNVEIDGLIHLAWYCGAKLHCSDVNLQYVAASMVLFDEFAKYGGKKFLGAGSVSEYNFDAPLTPFDEYESPINNESLYGQAKASVYRLGKTFFKSHNIEFKWARIFNLFGENEKDTRLIPSVIKSIKENKDVLVSECSQIQDYSYVKDTANAIAAFYDSDVQGPVNICSGTSLKLKDIVMLIAAKLNYPVSRINFGAFPKSFERPYIGGKNSRLVNEVGYVHKYNVSSGIDKLLESI